MEEDLLYLKMSELRAICLKLNISSKGVKTKLIKAICHFIQTGKPLPVPKMPNVSKAIKHKSYPLSKSTLMLDGNYKNDLATRQFFKQLIGPHFRFTAFGIDWLNQRWMAGNPPSYREFAAFWETEYQKRKIQKAPAKKEWAYINFVQSYIQEYPNANRGEIMAAWKQKQKLHFDKVLQTLEPFFTTQ